MAAPVHTVASNPNDVGLSGQFAVVLVDELKFQCDNCRMQRFWSSES